jgi:hypothetical protein
MDEQIGILGLSWIPGLFGISPRVSIPVYPFCAVRVVHSVCFSYKEQAEVNK